MFIMKKILLSILLLMFSCESPAEPEDCAGVAGGTAIFGNVIIN
jgi:hypothetical protein|tara:strand:- start:164 stop:295 length:132 start_codon:yes stop_codon:yes gene_type:complete